MINSNILESKFNKNPIAFSLWANWVFVLSTRTISLTILRKKVIILKRNSALEIRLGKSYKKLKANEESYSPPNT